MRTSVSSTELLVAVVTMLGLASVVIAFRLQNVPRGSGLGLAVAALPPAFVLVLFYSLAVHMHHVLGGWPASIGEAGFPPALENHAHVAVQCFTALVLLSFFVWPVLFLLSLAVRSCRQYVQFLVAYAVAAMISFGSMLLAPAQFLTWWWD